MRYYGVRWGVSVSRLGISRGCGRGNTKGRGLGQSRSSRFEVMTERSETFNLLGQSSSRNSAPTTEKRVARGLEMSCRRHAINLEDMDPGASAWFAQHKGCWPSPCYRHAVGLPETSQTSVRRIHNIQDRGALPRGREKLSAAHTPIPTQGSRVYSSEQHPCPARFLRSPSLSPLLFEGQRVCCRAGVRFSPFEVCESHEG